MVRLGIEEKYVFQNYLLPKLMKYIGVSIAFTIATIGTVGQTIGGIECPKTASDIPMCYLSLAFFAMLIFLKLS